MSTTAELSAQEAELLLYLEARLVEHRGAVRSDLMRPEELALAERWDAAGLLRFRALGAQDVDYRQSAPATHRVEFSERAWQLAGQARRARAGGEQNRSKSEQPPAR